MANNENDLIVAGLPATGKTTYIAAFWHVVGAGDVENSFILADLQPSREHLNELARKWRNCEKIRRTLLGNEKLIALNLEDRQTHDSVRITLPDSSGESFRRMFELRRWSPEFARLVEKTGLIMFFLHPSGIRLPARIGSVEDLVQLAERESSETPQAAKSDIEERGSGQVADKVAPQAPSDATNGDAAIRKDDAPKWRASFASPQSKIVDLLQLISLARQYKGIRIAIIVSAWDLVEPEGLTPEEWLNDRLPLVFQYLDAHKTHCPFKIFGVSAQGSDYKKDAAALRESVRASDRINVVEGKTSTHDITRPIRWLITRI